MSTKATATTVTIIPSRQEKLREGPISPTKSNSIPLTSRVNRAAKNIAKKLITVDMESVLISHKIHCFLFFTFLFLNY